MQKLFSVLLYFLLVFTVAPVWADVIVISNSGLTFAPDLVTIQVGDTVVWDIGSSHNVVEVSQTTYSANGAMSNGGFELPFGGGQVVFDTPGTYYYVCQPHASQSMKGRVIVEPQAVDDEVFVANLGGVNEVPTYYSTGSGSVTAVLSGDQLSLSGEFGRLNGAIATQIAGGAHIHLAAAGSNGPLVFPLVLTLDADSLGASIDPDSNQFTLSVEQQAQLRGQLMYINVHTEASPSGELRGQLVPESEEYFGANLMGVYAIPTVKTEACGSVVAQLNGGELVLSGSFGGFSTPVDTNIAGGMHIHVGFAGQTGGVEFILDATFNEDLTEGVFEASNNTFTLSESQIEFLRARGWYINIHTERVPSGEIRGQLRGPANRIYRAHLSGMNENPPIITGAHGMLIAELIDTFLIVSGSYNDLESSLDTSIAGGMHLHLGLAGTNGPLLGIIGFIGDSALLNGTIPANAFIIDNDVDNSLLLRNVYANFHSLEHPGGEVRGQLLAEAQSYYYARLTGAQEVHKVVSTGNGQIMLEARGEALMASGSVDLPSNVNYSIAGGIHLHQGMAGQNGGIVFPLNMIAILGDSMRGAVVGVQNIYNVSEGVLDTIDMRGTYINVHSEANAPGEVRGQMLGEAHNYFFAKLSGASEVPPSNNDGQGAIALEQTFNTIRSSGSFGSLESDLNEAIAGGVHYHYGLPGQNGPLLYLIDSDLSEGTSGVFRVDSNVIRTSENFLDSLRRRQVYVNVHSTDIPSGSVRGQVLGMSQAYMTSTLAGINELISAETEGRGAAMLELNNDRLTVVGSFDNLATSFDPNIAGGAHIHTGGPDANGPILININTEIAEDSLGGEFVSAENSFEITEEQWEILASEGAYFNIHTTGTPPGEIRGQVLTETNHFSEQTTISSPAEGADVLIAGDPLTPFVATWEPTTDPDGNEVVYIWQLSAFPDFSSVLVSSHQGVETTFETNFGTVNAILEGAGVTVGSSVTLYHRVLSSDGSVQTASEGSSVILTRGVVTSTEETPGVAVVLSVFPNPAADYAQLEISSTLGGNLDLQIIDVQGKLHHRQSLNVSPGENQRVSMHIQGMQPGLYIVQPLMDGHLLTPIRFVKQ